MSEPNKQHPPLVAIVGPTGVGKTRLGIALARQLGGEIVNADSRQVYREMNIGTAKPTPAEQAAARHHLIDVVHPDEPFSLALYVRMAAGAIADITARGRLPLLVGGTGQYVTAILEGWQVPEVPPQPELRARLEAEAHASGAPALHARLAAVDPQAAANIDANNLRRIVRALEVYETTGLPISQLQRREPPPYTIKTLWLSLPRERLYPRIDDRVDAMMAAGLVDEVAGLLQRGYDWSLPAMSSLGYKEFRPFFEHGAPLADCVQRLKWNTHAFVRKQDMWWRRLPNARQLDADGVMSDER